MTLSHVFLGRLLHICLDNPTQAEHRRSKIDLTFTTSLFLRSVSVIGIASIHFSKQHLGGFTSATMKTPSSLGVQVSRIFCSSSFLHSSCCLSQGCPVPVFSSVTASLIIYHPYSRILLATFLCSRTRLCFWNSNLTRPWPSLQDTGQIPPVLARA